MQSGHAQDRSARYARLTHPDRLYDTWLAFLSLGPHLSIFTGCTDKHFWTCVFTIDENGQVARHVMGCDPSTCLGLRDKAMSGFCIDCSACRSAAAHFGHCNAGSLLVTLVQAI